MQRPFWGKRLLEGGLAEEIRHRAEVARLDLEKLEARVVFSPFLEIGAGSGQRSITLMQRFAAPGVATDVSQNVLQNALFSSILLKAQTIPLLVCCDAHHLPFLANTFRFVFAYRTLHHFDNPLPVVAECYRVLGQGGHFFFNEEPMDSPLRRLLRGQRMVSSPPTLWQRLARRLGVLKVFWDDGAWERSVGITEARFDHSLWIEALRPFEKVEVEINRKLRIMSDLHRPLVQARLSGIVGGNVKGLCQKLSGEPPSEDFQERLMCLDCQATGLQRVSAQGMQCAACKRTYPINLGVIRMLPLALEVELYG